ncbi:Uncharacterised protein [Vibrio cholerae]|nr:Uncharacterised protein [Vibrio cholerae]
MFSAAFSAALACMVSATRLSNASSAARVSSSLISGLPANTCSIPFSTRSLFRSMPISLGFSILVLR